MIAVALKDGTEKQLAESRTAFEVAQDIGPRLAKVALAATKKYSRTV